MSVILDMLPRQLKVLVLPFNRQLGIVYDGVAGSTTKAHFFITPEGWCNGIARSPCENFDARPEQTVIDLLVIHNISLPPEEYGGSYIEDLFANRLDCDAHPYFEKLRDLKVSAHFLIKRDGNAHQFVATQDRAWHAGAPEYKGRARCNDFSIVFHRSTCANGFCNHCIGVS